VRYAPWRDERHFMRIQGPAGTTSIATSSAPRRTAGGSFTPKEVADSRPASSTSATRTVGGIDALMALQGVEDALERRKYAIKRGRLALDALDELKIGLLGGTLSQATLAKLRTAAGHFKDSSGEAGLDSVLGEIELRVAVELAKMAPR
jgi:hypothetical protein